VDRGGGENHHRNIENGKKKQCCAFLVLLNGNNGARYKRYERGRNAVRALISTGSCKRGVLDKMNGFERLRHRINVFLAYGMKIDEKRLLLGF
jgi:hypothetical protein